MSFESFEPILIDRFGGLNTLLSSADLPVGASPDCRNVKFQPSGLAQREGLSVPFAVIGGNPTVNGLKSYVKLDGTQRLLVFTGAGELYKESSAGVLALVGSGLGSGRYLASTTIYSREYLGFSDGKTGQIQPRHFDDTNLDKVSVPAPTVAPTVADSAIAGSVCAGAHSCEVMYQTRSGYITKPGPTVSWTAAGSKKASVTNIPVSPDAEVTKRILAFTLAGGASYYYLSTFIINDNTTTAVTVDFTENALVPGTNVDSYARKIVLPNMAGVIDYNRRLFWWGEAAFPSIVRASEVDDPETFFGDTGFFQVAENNGQRVTAVFRLRNLLYVLKERSLYVTQDDGINPPSKWTIEEVDNKVGTPSIHGVAVGEEWAVIAGRAGVYLFEGSRPQKISQEIQPTWDTINWDYGHLVWVEVDVQAKRIYIAAPTGTATKPNVVFVLDYTEGFGGDESNLEETAGAGRKWTIWDIAANSLALVERLSPQVSQLFFGNNVGNGKIYRLDAIQYSDDGAAINAYYRTAFLSASKGIGQQLLGGLTLHASGIGQLSLTAYATDDSVAVNLDPPIPLSQTPDRDLYRLANLINERLSLKFGMNQANTYWKVDKITAWMKAWYLVGVPV